jgi:hypothetical protein
VNIDMFYTMEYASTGSAFHGQWTNLAPPKFGKTTMAISNVVIRNVTSKGHRYEGSFACDSQSPCTNFTLDDVRFGGDDGDSPWTCPEGAGDDCCQSINGQIGDVKPELGHCFDHSRR